MYRFLSASPSLQSFYFFIKILFIRILEFNCDQIAGCVSSSPESLNLLLSKKPAPPYTGRATILIVGGAAEVMESKPGTYRILIKRRKGFIKLALKNGLELLLFSADWVDLITSS